MSIVSIHKNKRGIEMVEILKEGPVRKFLKERETLVPRKKLVDVVGGSSSILIDREVDAVIERMKAEKVREWRAKGYSEHLIDMASRLSQEWVASMGKAFAPTMPEVQSAIIRATFPKALEVGDRWIREMAK